MPVKSGINADAINIDLHYQHTTGPPVTANFNALTTAISHFFNSTATGASLSVNHWMGDVFNLTSNAASVKFYKVPTGGGALGSPVEVHQWTNASSGSGTLPEECAAVLSFRTDYGTAVEFSGGQRPRSRLRNRIYLGPLTTSARAQDATTKRCFIAAQAVTDILDAAVQYLCTEALSGDWSWKVVSQRNLTDYAVHFASMDDAFDSQRRRGPKPTVRVETPRF